MVSIQSKLPHQGTSIFAIMSQMATENNAINLSQGFPDFPISQTLIDMVNTNMQKGNNQYAPMAGIPALREAISEVVFSSYECKVDPDLEITITSGATEALFATISALVEMNDEVILFDPCYDSYAPAIKLAGGKPVHINLQSETYAINWAEVKKSITNHTKLIIINTPHNPSGAVLSEEDMLMLQGIAIENNLIVISDEVYERIIFDDEVHQSVLKYPKLAERSIAIFSFGKTFHATGWKVGYAIAPEKFTREIRKIHQYLTFSVNTPVQFALAEYLQNKENYINLGSLYQKKRDFFSEQISNSNFEILPCKGTYFQLLSYKKISDKTEMDMAEYLTKVHGVAAIPTSAFYKEEIDNQVLRFCFAKSQETLEKAAQILCKI